MPDTGELFKQFNEGNGEWKNFIRKIKINNIHGWTGQEISFNFPVVAIVGENGIGKSTFLKAAVCAYNNKSGKSFYPSKMFMSTYWDVKELAGATIEYEVKVGEKIRSLKWKKTKDWGYTPKKNKPARNVFFLDISRTLPLDATAGYAKIAMQSNTEMAGQNQLDKETINAISYVLGQKYTDAKFTSTLLDEKKEVGILTKFGKEISQFHQGAGEDSILDTFRLLQDMPKEALLVIDEVENSLHPQAQRRFVRYLLKLARIKKIQIILSTHSSYVLEELPLKARIMLLNLSDRKEVIYNVSTEYALSTIDDKRHPEVIIHLEDDEAIVMFWEIMKHDADNYDLWQARFSTLAVGSCSVVATLSNLASQNKLPYKSISIVDGDKKEECSKCLSLPGDEAPEKQIFNDLKRINWKDLDERFGIGAGMLFKYLDDAMLVPNHHEWTTYVGDKIKKNKDIVWQILVDQWCKMVLQDDVKNNFIEQITEKYESIK